MCLPMWKFYLPIAYQFAKETKSRLLLPDYRLAPESCFPAALDDCLDAVRWVTSQWTQRDELVVVGDSAGGNLALNMAIDINSPKGLVLMSPWLDLSHSSKWWAADSEDDVVFPIPARRAAWLYVRGDDDWDFGNFDPEAVNKFETAVKNPRVSPLFGDLTFASASSVLIQASRSERLLGDSCMLWEKLSGLPPNINVPSGSEKITTNHNTHQLSIWDNTPHVWQITRPWSAAGVHAVSDIVQFVNSL